MNAVIETAYPPLSADFIDSILSFDEKSGRFYWIKPSKYHNEKIGAQAGCPRSGYWRIKIHRLPYLRSRLAFCVSFRKWPDLYVDHINGDTLDDRPDNLRVVNHYQNAWNHVRQQRGRKLAAGIRILPSGNFQARITYKHKQIALGAFPTIMDALIARCEAEENLYRQFRRK